MNNLLDIAGLQRADIEKLLDSAVEIKGRLQKSGKYCNDLKGKTVMTMFYENSTRTRISFESAAKFLGAEVINIPVDASSVKKGETLIDTTKTLDKLCPDLIVVRHNASGAPQIVAKNTRAKVINAGDGLHAHPTQALLDMFTIREHFGKIEGLKVAIVGDIKHSRVARSNIEALSKFNVRPKLYSPKTLMCEGLDKADIADSLEQAVKDADVIIGLRIQLERQKAGLFPDVAEYAKFYGISTQLLSLAAKDVIVMHPGPVNRGVEISDEMLKSPCCLKDEQVQNGLAVRMAVMKAMLGD